MKYDNYSDNFKDMFQNTFANIEATDEFKKCIKVSVKDKMKSPDKKVFSFKSSYKLALVAACFILVIIITNFGSIKAGLMNVYEYFFSNIDHQYTSNTKDYVVDINKEFIIDKDISIEFDQAMFLEQGMDLKYKICNDTGAYDLVGCEIKFEYSGKTFELSQEMYTKLESGYLSSCVFTDEFSDITFNQFLKKELNFKINILYVQNKSDDKMCEKQFELILVPHKIFKSESITSIDNVIYQDEYVRVHSIHITGWYIKANYEVLFDYDMNEKMFSLVFSVDDKDLVPLSGVSNGDNLFDAYYGLPDKELSKVKITPVFYSYDDTILNYTKLNNGKEIILHIMCKEDN